MKKHIILSLIFSGMTLNACNRPTLPQAIAPQRLAQRHIQPQRFSRLNASTFQLNQKSTLFKHHKAKQVQSIHSNSMILNGQTGIKQGDIVIGRSRGQDFLRQVVGVNQTANQAVLRTQPALLHDAFDEINLRGFEPEPGALQAIEQKLNRKTYNIGGLLDLVPRLKIKPDFSNTEIRLRKTTLTIKVAPITRITGQIEARFSPFSDQTKIVNIFKLPPTQPLGRVELPGASIPGWIGPVPIVFNLTPSVSLDWSSQASGYFFFGAELNGQITTGIEITAKLGKKPTYKTFKDWGFEARLTEPGFKVQGEVRSKLNVPEIQVDTKIAGMVGPFVRFSPYLDGKVKQTTVVKPKGTSVEGSARSDLGLVLRGGITETSIFGFKLAKGLDVRILDKTIKEVYRKDLKEYIPHPTP